MARQDVIDGINDILNRTPNNKYTHVDLANILNEILDIIPENYSLSYLNGILALSVDGIEVATTNLIQGSINHSFLNLDDGTNPHGVTKGDVGLGNVPNIDATDRNNHTGTQPASTITDFDTEVSNNIDVQTNSLKISATGNELEPNDINTISKLNSIISDADLIDTNDPRLSDDRAPISHTHTKSEISDFNDADYATASQGSNADTALQPNDNVSELNNDSGYLSENEFNGIKYFTKQYVCVNTIPISKALKETSIDFQDNETVVYKDLQGNVLNSVSEVLPDSVEMSLNGFILSFKDECGAIVDVDLQNLVKISNISSNNTGKIIATHTNGDGADVNIEETITTLQDNGDETFTYTSEDNVETTIDLNAYLKSSDFNEIKHLTREDVKLVEIKDNFYPNSVFFSSFGVPENHLMYFHEANFQSSGNFQTSDFLVPFGETFVNISDFKERYPEAPVLYAENGIITNQIAYNFVENYINMLNNFLNINISNYGYNISQISGDDFINIYLEGLYSDYLIDPLDDILTSVYELGSGNSIQLNNLNFFSQNNVNLKDFSNSFKLDGVRETSIDFQDNETVVYKDLQGNVLNNYVEFLRKNQKVDIIGNLLKITDECGNEDSVILPTSSGGNAFDPSLLQVFGSIQQATIVLGTNQLFLWSENNIYGVISPNNSTIGKT